MGRPNNKKIRERNRFVEDLLIRRTRRSRIIELCEKRYGMARPAVDRAIRSVRDLWAEEASQEDRHHRRNELRQQASDLYASAVNRREVVRDKDGNPVFDAQGNPVTFHQPDVRGATRIIETLARLDGLYEDKVTIEAGGSITDLMALAFAAPPQAMSPPPKRLRPVVIEALPAETMDDAGSGASRAGAQPTATPPQPPSQKLRGAKG